MRNLSSLSIALSLASIAVLLFGCHQQKEVWEIEREWVSVGVEFVGGTRDAVGANLGPATCSDSLTDSRYPGEEVVTFSKAGFDYRVHFRKDKVVRAFMAKAVE